MPQHRTAPIRVLAAAAFVALSAGMLSGCSVVDELLYKQKASSFESAAGAPESSFAHAAWVPDDATDIRIVESTAAADPTAVILLTSPASLAPAECAEIDRMSGAAYTIDGAPDPYEAKTAYACGAWTVIAAEDGWFGWTPNHPDEEALSPSGS
jgi:hypothetical protein